MSGNIFCRDNLNYSRCFFYGIFYNFGNVQILYKNHLLITFTQICFHILS